MAGLSKKDLPEVDAATGDADDPGELDSEPEAPPDTFDAVDPDETLEPPPDTDAPDVPGEDSVVDGTDMDTEEPPAGCRIPIMVNAGSGTSDLTDYQIMLRIHYETGMSADFSDLRFEDASTAGSAAFWIEDKVDGDHADVWVKFPFVPAGSDRNYLCRYGDPEAPGGGDPRAVFDVFEDFESGSLSDWLAVGGNVWQITTLNAHGGTRSVTMSPIFGAEHFLHHAILSGTDITFEAWVYAEAGTDYGFNVRAARSLPMSGYHFGDDDEFGLVAGKWTSGSWTTLYESGITYPHYGAWTKWSVTVVGTELKAVINDSLALPDPGFYAMGSGLSSGTVGFLAYVAPATESLIFDDIRVRKAGLAEPAVTLGAALCD